MISKIIYTWCVSENRGCQIIVLDCIGEIRYLHCCRQNKSFNEGCLQEHVSWYFTMTPTRVTNLVNLHTLFELYSGPFVLTSRRYTPCFMFLMVTGFILLGWMSRLVWVSPSQMPIRHLWLLITCQPLGLRSSGSHTWLHPDYILPPARFIWLFMVRAVLLQSTKSNATDWKRVSRGVPNPKLDFTTLTIIFNVKSVHVSGL